MNSRLFSDEQAWVDVFAAANLLGHFPDIYRFLAPAQFDRSDIFKPIPDLRIHHAGGVSTELEHHLLLAGAGLQIPADGGRAGEAQQLEALVGGEQLGAGAAARQDREGALGQVGLGQHLADDERAEWRAAGRGPVGLDRSRARAGDEN